MTYKLEYNFYYDYDNETFNNIFNKRKQNILLNTNSQYKECKEESDFLSNRVMERVF